MGESTAVSWQQPEQRKNCTDGQCHHAAVPSLTPSSGGGRMLEFGLWRSEMGRGLGLSVWRQTGDAGIQCDHSWALRGRSLGCLRGQLPLFEGCTRGGAGPDCSLFPWVHSLPEGRRTLPAQAPGAVMSHYPCPPGPWDWSQAPLHLPPGPREWSQAAATLVESWSGQEPPPIQTPAVVVSHLRSHPMLWWCA